MDTQVTPYLRRRVLALPLEERIALVSLLTDSLRVREKDEERLRRMTFYCHSGSCLRAYLLRYFARMAKIKEAISQHKYERLTFEQLRWILYSPAGVLTDQLFYEFDIRIEFQL